MRSPGLRTAVILILLLELKSMQKFGNWALCMNFFKNLHKLWLADIKFLTDDRTDGMLVLLLLFKLNGGERFLLAKKHISFELLLFRRALELMRDVKPRLTDDDFSFFRFLDNRPKTKALILQNFLPNICFDFELL